MQNIFLLGLQNNCFLTSQIRLSWKTKLLLLISHGPMHTCSIWEISWAGACRSLGVSRLRLGVQRQLDLESAGSQGKGSQGKGFQSQGL